MKWEYAIRTSEEEFWSQDIEMLNIMGDAGWELVQVRHKGRVTSYFFKRPIVEVVG